MLSVYSPTTTYSVGDIVIFNGNPYVMVQGSGQPGYPPLRSGDQLWKVFKGVYDNAHVYAVGDAVIMNSSIYWMQEGAGQPGYPPLRPGDHLWVTVQGFSYPRGGARRSKSRKARRAKARKASRRH